MSSTFEQLFTGQAGIALMVLILLAGLAFFVPAIVAGMRSVRVKELLCVVNVLAVATVFIDAMVPVLVWLVCIIAAFIADPIPGAQSEYPEI